MSAARSQSRLVLLPLAVLVGLGVAGCDAGEPPAATRSPAAVDQSAEPDSPKRRSSPALERAIDRAIAYLDDPAVRNDYYVLNVLDFLERRYELGVWEDVPERYAEYHAALERIDPQKELFRRLIEPDYVATPEQLAAAEEIVDQVTTAALYCPDHPLPPDMAARLRRLAVNGRYHLTHAGMAIQWLRENGCEADVDSIESYVVDLMASGIRSGDATSDLEIERAAFLHYMGHADRVPSGFAGDLIRRQNGDGGWPIEASGESNWHPTFLAVWILLEVDGRGNGAPMIVPREGKG